jgi:hypothetical protein
MTTRKKLPEGSNRLLPGHIDTAFIRRKIGARPNYEIEGLQVGGGVQRHELRFFTACRCSTWNCYRKAQTSFALRLFGRSACT